MVHRIEIGLKKEIRDPLGEKVRRRVESDLGLVLGSVRTLSVFTLDMELSKEELEMIATGPFLDPIIQEYRIDEPLAHDYDWLAEVGFKPGVTDNVGKTAKEAIEWRLGRRLKEEEKLYTSSQYLFRGDLRRKEVERICTDLLGNSLIQRFEVWKADEAMGKIEPKVPKVRGETVGKVEEIDLNISDQDLFELSQARLLALDLRESPQTLILSWVKVPGAEGFYVINGFSGHGFMHGPACGLLLAEEILEGKAHTLDITSLSLSRFREGRYILEYNVV